MTKFKVTTDAGVLVTAGYVGGGLSEVEAEADCKDRNERASRMGLAVRYSVHPKEEEDE